MQPITVAIVEINQNQPVSVENFLQHNDTKVELLADIPSNYDHVRERRQTLRNSEAAIENAVARIKRLRPQILLINANQAIDEYCDLLFVLRYECPDTQAILIINEAVEENYLLETLACGARGFITDNLDSLNFSKVIDAINRGEAWVSRKLVGKIMHQIVSASRNDFIEAGFDSSC